MAPSALHSPCLEKFIDHTLEAHVVGGGKNITRRENICGETHRLEIQAQVNLILGTITMTLGTSCTCVSFFGDIGIITFPLLIFEP